MKRLDKAAEAIARSILHCDSMRVISHNDADGITSAGLICSALLRAGIPFQATLCNRLDESVLAGLEGTSYIERVAVNSPANIRKTRQAIAKGFQHQLKKTGFSMVEILSPCPTNWKMAAAESCRWIDEVMTRQYPLGVIKETKC